MLLYHVGVFSLYLPMMILSLDLSVSEKLFFVSASLGKVTKFSVTFLFSLLFLQDIGIMIYHDFISFNKCHEQWQYETIMVLTHLGRVTHICVSKLTIIGADNGLSPGRRQAIIYTNDGILLIGPQGTNFSEILIKIHTFSLKKMHLKMSSGK